MFECKPVHTPKTLGAKISKLDDKKVNYTYFKSLVRSIRYLTCTRPDILFVVGLVSRYMECISLTKNLVFHGRSKHIDTRYYFIREFVAKK
ncbi:hypothetical protein CFOL_v3_05622 [Cephalotus follicularis]|uniref:RVT_2 domain-containing protein n=1 Tax=Cephalotus follicularis TaxID=3775 RepID=A0A1Q3B2B2_CEPFO|nr:hypothetical protein CFOL_v3_05622 [Cephalotus follicularis]